MVDLKGRKLRAEDLLNRALNVVSEISSDTARNEYTFLAHENTCRLISSIRGCIETLNQIPFEPDKEKKTT